LINRTIDKYSSNPGLDKLTVFELALFSFLTGNADMHLKNFSVIYKNGMISLSPAYDLISTRLVIPEKDDPEETALMINGKRRNLQLPDFLKLGESSGLNKRQIENTLNKFKEKFEEVINFIDLSFLNDKRKVDYKNLLISRWKRLNIQ